MAATATGRVALFSIKPTYADALMNGTKQVEFRRQPLPADVTEVVVYATSPVQRVVGSFSVDGVEVLSPDEAWGRYSHVGGIEKEAFFAYYTGTETAYVIKVGRSTPAALPFTLGDVSSALRPPQSFMYLRDDALDQTQTLLSQQPTPPKSSPAGALLDRLTRILTNRLLG